MDTDPRQPQRVPGPIPVTRWDEEPGWAGIQTFMKLPLCFTPEDLAAGRIDVAIAGEPWDCTAVSYIGSRLGPKSVRTVDHLMNPPLERPHQHVRVDPMRSLRACDYGDANVIHSDTERTFANIREFVNGILSANTMPMLVGGDHAVTYPNVAAFADSFGKGNVTLIHFDAHPDTAHRIQGVAYDNSTFARRLIDDGLVDPRHVIQVGLRGYWPGPEDLAWMAHSGMRSHYMVEIQERGLDAVLDTVIAEARECPPTVFVSFDIDVVDPAFAPATGSPEPGGLTSFQALRSVRRIAAELGIAGMDIVEVSPGYDVPSNITSLLAHRLILEAMTGTAMHRSGLTAPRYTDPTAAARKNAASDVPTTTDTQL
jgi:agmatinase